MRLAFGISNRAAARNAAVHVNSHIITVRPVGRREVAVLSCDTHEEQIALGLKVLGQVPALELAKHPDTDHS